jgi:hypothetical protein
VAVGGAFVTSVVLFSLASGIFHPYYVSLLAPFTAALVGAGAAQLIGGAMNVRIFGPFALAAGVASELVVLGDYPGQLSWLGPLLIVLGALAALALAMRAGHRTRVIAVGTAIAGLLVAPSVWAVDTLGYAASGTFPSGGPASAQDAGPGGALGRASGRAFGPVNGSRRLLGAGGPGGGFAPPGGPPGARGAGSPAGFTGAAPAAPGGAIGGAGSSRLLFSAGFGAGPLGGQGSSLTQVVSYVRRHGGGTIALASQSSAASAIIAQHASVAGIGGFSGRESTVSVAWLAQEVRAGHIRWVLAAQGRRSGGPGLSGDTRSGSKAAMAAVATACRAVSLPASSGAGATSSSSGGIAGASGGATLYDCKGRAQQLSG